MLAKRIDEYNLSLKPLLNQLKILSKMNQYALRGEIRNFLRTRRPLLYKIEKVGIQSGIESTAFFVRLHLRSGFDDDSLKRFTTFQN